MLKKLMGCLHLRKVRKLPLEDLVNEAVMRSINHMIEDRCTHLIAEVIQSPDYELSLALMRFYEAMTPFEFNHIDQTFTHNVVRSGNVSMVNLREFLSKYDGKFTNWATDNLVGFTLPTSGMMDA